MEANRSLISSARVDVFSVVETKVRLKILKSSYSFFSVKPVDREQTAAIQNFVCGDGKIRLVDNVRTLMRPSDAYEYMYPRINPWLDRHPCLKPGKVISKNILESLVIIGRCYYEVSLVAGLNLFVI